MKGSPSHHSSGQVSRTNSILKKGSSPLLPDGAAAERTLSGFSFPPRGEVDSLVRKASHASIGSAAPSCPNGVWRDDQMVLSIAVSESGCVITGGSSEGDITLWNPTTGEPECLLAGHTQPVLSFYYIPRRSMLLSSSADSTVRLWNLKLLEEVQSFSGHTGLVVGLAYVPSDEGVGVYTGGDDGLIKQWSEDSGMCVFTFQGHKGPVNCLVGSGTHLYSGSSDGTIRTWDLYLRAEARVVESAHGGTPVWCLRLRPEGSVVSGGGDGAVRVWTNPVVNSNIYLDIPHAHKGCVKCLALHGTIAVSGGEDCKVKIWDLTTGALVDSLRPHVKAVTGLLLHNNTIYSTSFDGTIPYYNVESILPVRQPYIKYISIHDQMHKFEAEAAEKAKATIVSEKTRSVRLRKEPIRTILSFYTSLPLSKLQSCLLREVQVTRLRNELIIYVVFLLIFVFFFLLARSVDALHYTVTGINNELELSFLPTMQVNENFNDINELGKWTNWVLGVLVPAVYGSAFPTTTNVRAVQGQNIVLGAVQFRVLNVHGGGHGCPFRLIRFPDDPDADQCFGDVGHEQNWDRKELVLNVTSIPRLQNNLNQTVVPFATRGGTVSGQLQEYPRAGFTLDLPATMSLENATNIVSEFLLAALSTRGTRYCSVAAVTYNAQLDTFLYSEYFLEVSTTGVMLASNVNRAFIVFALDPGTMTLESIFCLFLLYFTVVYLHGFGRAVWLGGTPFLLFVTDTWNLLELVNLGFFFVMYAYRIRWILATDGVTDLVPSLEEYPYNLEEVSDLYFMQLLLNAINTILTFLKALKYVRLNDSLNVLTRTLAVSANSLVGLLGLFLFLVLGFAIAGHALFGANVFEYRTLDGSFSALLRILVQDFEFDELFHENTVGTLIFFWMYVIVAGFVLLNLLVAVINDGFAEVMSGNTMIPLDETVGKMIDDARYGLVPEVLKRRIALVLNGYTRPTILEKTREYFLSRCHEEEALVRDYRVDKADFLGYGRVLSEDDDGDNDGKSAASLLRLSIEEVLQRSWNSVAWQYHHELLQDTGEDEDEKNSFITEVVQSALAPFRATITRIDKIGWRLEASRQKLAEC
eukprot:PhM_4_TR2713/c0_g1_i1/m.37503